LHHAQVVKRARFDLALRTAIVVLLLRLSLSQL